MIGPSMKTLWPGLIELTDPNKLDIELNYRLKDGASDAEKKDFEYYQNSTNGNALRAIYKDLKEPYYTWEGKVVEQSSLKDRELPLVD